MKTMILGTIGAGLLLSQLGVGTALADTHPKFSYDRAHYPHLYGGSRQRARGPSAERRVSARLPAHMETNGRKVFYFSPRALQWAAYDERGKRVAHGRASGGATFCNDVKRPCKTPQGTFKVLRKGTAACRSSKYPLPKGGAPMPYCMHFLKSYAIHGSPYVPNHNGSHGCIRVKTSAAHWLHKNFIDHGTVVKVGSY